MLVKPQFEVGRGRLNRQGVVTDPKDRTRALEQVVAAVGEHGLHVHGIMTSPISGGARQHRVPPVGPVGAVGHNERGPGPRRRARDHHARPERRTTMTTTPARRILLVTHVGRPEAQRLAADVATRLLAAGVGVCAPPDELVDTPLATSPASRRPPPYPPTAPTPPRRAASWSACSAATARSCAAPSSRAARACPCSGSTSATSASSPRPSAKTSTPPSSASSRATTPSRSG